MFNEGIQEIIVAPFMALGDEAAADKASAILLFSLGGAWRIEALVSKRYNSASVRHVVERDRLRTDPSPV